MSRYGKPYKARSLRGAQTYVRCLQKQLKHVTAMMEQYHHERVQLAKLAAKGPTFADPMQAWAAEAIRNKILWDWCKLNPDGTPITEPKGAPHV